MAFVSTFAGLLAALVIWVGAYALASEADAPALNAMATYLEALNPVGETLFLVLAVLIAMGVYRWLKTRARDNAPN
jgi:membrane protein implicated in regulation of membrane protease activity